MKKILLVIGLIAVLAGIAYVKAIYSSQDSQGDITSARPSLSDDDLYENYMKKDDVLTMMDSLKQHYHDSMHTVIVDSLSVLTMALQNRADTSSPVESPVVDSLQKANDELNERLARANAEIKRINQSKTEQVEKYAEVFYKEEMNALPSDLTDYERAVMVKEIKAKTQKYFNLSARSVQDIAKKYN
ncbi:MAG: hypothetical protein R3F48_09810 [Candidatus Zixiibacteriota bacterium]